MAMLEDNPEVMMKVNLMAMLKASLKDQKVILQHLESLRIHKTQPLFQTAIRLLVKVTFLLRSGKLWQICSTPFLTHRKLVKITTTVLLLLLQTLVRLLQSRIKKRMGEISGQYLTSI
ncbi:hypothetical protein BZY71_24740 [Leclercia adecarboxylata]|nr:hypothetical protein BZY71_24740 [Leclercia adecarboxylata]